MMKPNAIMSKEKQKKKLDKKERMNIYFFNFKNKLNLWELFSKSLEFIDNFRVICITFFIHRILFIG